MKGYAKNIDYLDCIDYILSISLWYPLKTRMDTSSKITLHVQFVNLDDLKTGKLRLVIFRLFQNAMDCFNFDTRNVSSMSG